MRRQKSAIEIVSDIGCKAFDLQYHSERDIIEAVVILRQVNGPMFDWLTQILIGGTMVEMAKQSPPSPETRTEPARDNGYVYAGRLDVQAAPPSPETEQ